MTRDVMEHLHGLFVRELMEFLNENYEGRCVAVAWPARSPDFNILKCILWNYVRR